MVPDGAARLRRERATFRSWNARAHVLQPAPQGRRRSVVLGIELALFCVAMNLLMATPTLAQTGNQPFTPLSGIPGLTPPEEAVGRAVERLCPQLSPSSTGATGDLQMLHRTDRQCARRQSSGRAQPTLGDVDEGSQQSGHQFHRDVEYSIHQCERSSGRFTQRHKGAQPPGISL
jgi:hypothetical protein